MFSDVNQLPFAENSHWLHILDLGRGEDTIVLHMQKAAFLVRWFKCNRTCTKNCNFINIRTCVDKLFLPDLISKGDEMINFDSVLPQ